MRILYLVVLVLLWPALSISAISFTDNKWETTFDCAEQTQFVGSLDCDGMVWSGNWSVDGKLTTIESAANNPVGDGRGARFWKGSGGDNRGSGTIAVQFPTPQQELWVRWYERYESGFEWNNSIDVKSLYFKATDSNPYVGYQLSDYRFYWGGAGGGPTFPRASGYGWDYVYPTGTADGTWHCFEVYMKMDTNGTDGEGKIWIDGVLVGEHSGFSWSAGSNHPGWTYFTFLSNQKNPGLSRAYYVDFDDMVIYNSTPPATDDEGNAFIGPIGWTSGADTTPPAISEGSPFGSQPSGTTSVTMQVATHENATCRYSATAETAYASMGSTFSTTGTTAHSTTISGLEDDGIYNYYVRCIDGEGNANTIDYPVSWSVATTLGDDPVTGLRKLSLLMSENFSDNTWTEWYDGTDSTGTAAGGVDGNALKWTWAAAATKPTGFSTLRQQFTETDEFLIEYYVLYETGWRGSGAAYHPHLIHVVSSDDWTETGYGATAENHSNLYFEALANTGSPYTNYPLIQHQDSLRINYANGTPPVDLTDTTEDRSANHCNTPYELTWAGTGTCYGSTGDMYSANMWKSQSVAIPINQWVKISAYIKMNTFSAGAGNFDGIMRLWVDDELAIDASTVLYAAGQYEGTTWDKVVLAPYMQPGSGSPIEQTMWLDELKIWSVQQSTSGPLRQGAFRIGGVPARFVEAQP